MTTKSTLLIIEKSLSSCSSSHRPRDSASILDFFPSSLPFSAILLSPLPPPPPASFFPDISFPSLLTSLPFPSRVAEIETSREKKYSRALPSQRVHCLFRFLSRCTGSQPASQPPSQA